MYTYRIDLKLGIFAKFKYDKRNNSSIWIDGSRRDTVTERYMYVDDITEVESILAELLAEQELVAKATVTKEFIAKRAELAKAIEQAQTVLGRL